VTAGYARKSLRTLQTSYFTDRNYTERVLAQASSLSTHQSGSKGALVTVKGNGFTSDPTDYTCNVAGQVCSVTAASLTEVTVQVPILNGANTAFGALPQDGTDTSTQQNNFLGSNGLSYKRYDRGDLWKSTT